MSIGISISDIIKLCEVASRIYKNCRDCTGQYKSLAADARSLTNVLEDISDKYESIPESKRQQLFDAHETCVEVLDELDKALLHYNSLDTRSKRAWDRLTWDPEKSRLLRERLMSSVIILNSFYNSLIHDSQVLILEALGRLEKDYKGGHREGSIASVKIVVSGSADMDDKDEEDTAWSQIIRDLEDVGITRKDALEYREFIVEWFVRAINDGRLLEEGIEPKPTDQSFDSVPQGVGRALPSLSVQPASDKSSSSSSASTPITSKNELRSEKSISDYDPPLSSSATETSIRAHPGWITVDSDELIMDNLLYSQGEKIYRARRKQDFVTAEKFLADQVAAVERGVTIAHLGHTSQPDRRLLRYLTGICASYSGDFQKAKENFESVFNGIYLNRDNLDEGDIAAARWLGDACLHLHEPHNTALAWSVALNGLIWRCGAQDDRTQCVREELVVLDRGLLSLRHLANSFKQGHDPTDIFMNTHVTEKPVLIQFAINHMRNLLATNTLLSSRVIIGPRIWRPRTAQTFSQTLFYMPLPDKHAWPLQWDETFLPRDAIFFVWFMSSLSSHSSTQMLLSARELPTVGLMNARELHYVTKRGQSQRWLVNTIKRGLQEHGIEHREDGTTIMCYIHERNSGFAYDQAIVIKFKKLQFRRMYGLKVVDSYCATRTARGPNESVFIMPEVLAKFINMVKDILDKAGRDERDSTITN